MIEMTLKHRRCECCGSNDLELVWSNQSIVKKATVTWLFPVRLVVCRQCGFCFTSPSPAIGDLGRYYADSLSGYKGIGVPYAIERRVSLLSRHSVPSGILLEVGGDNPEDFHKRCDGLFSKIINVEVAEDAPADHRSVEELPAESVDVIAHYDVLEHIPAVKNFLSACRRVLKKNGVMVCEVPDIRLYPRNLLLMEFEHVNHFSVSTLAYIGQACGLRLIEAGHICSRPYGFVSVFCKCQPVVDLKVNLPFEYVDTLACVKGGLDQVQNLSSNIKVLQVKVNELTEQEGKITLWGVTDLLRRFLENYRLPDTAIVVDSDPRRNTHLACEGIPVLLPENCQEHIFQSKLMAIFAPRYTMEILDWVKKETGKTFDMAEVVVIGSGPSGETLL